MAIHLSSVDSAMAHSTEGVLQTGDRPVGEYLLYAWTSPSIVRVGESHLDVLITTQDGKPVDDLEVEMLVTLPTVEVAQRFSTIAPIEGERFRYEGAVIFSKPGTYAVEIMVSEGAKHIGTTSFDIRVAPSILWGKLALNGMMISLVAVALWFTCHEPR